ncbi:MAG: permease, partial [Stellaceae bacterium]
GLDQFAAKTFKGRESRMIIVASVIGAALPFCSCGVIPLVAGLLGAGVPLAPVMAFWISSPLMDPTQFFIASGVLGIGFATAKMLSAVGMWMLSGFGTMMLIRAGWLDAPAALRISDMPARSCCGSKPAVIAPPIKSCCGSAKGAAEPKSIVLWRFWTDAARAQRFLTTATSTGWFLVRWLAVAYALESLMVAWLPTHLVGQWLGVGAGPLAVPLAVALGFPVYLNSFAAIPFVSGLIGLGMSPATGLAFMLATSATGFPAMVAVWALVKPRAFALYLGFAVVGAIVAGYAYSAVLKLIT